ncbi:MAG: hypothetical protein Fur002_16240 [Anaerolineales bacterium]
MNALPYFAGSRPVESAPLARFLPDLEEGCASAWLASRKASLTLTGNWILDPFGFSPRLVLELAQSGFRVLVTVNNPISRFLLEMYANPPAPAEFTAALADLSAVKKGDERLGAHLQNLYLTVCQTCEKRIYAQAFLWRKGASAPYAKVYQCPHCGDSGERLAAEEDIERATKIAATDSLHRARAYEKVVALQDEDRIYAEEAIDHYLPRPLYALTTILNRLDSLNLSPERKRALTALTLLACDAGNTLWTQERPRPKQLTTPNQFRENNLWQALEDGIKLWARVGARVPCETWKNKIPESGGVLIYEGRLKDLAREVKKEIPIAAVIGSTPRPNQAFWTLSALWAGWLWGKEAVEPYKPALRRRRYDWAWNATALSAAFKHLNELLPDGTPFFALLPEPEPAYLSSVFLAADSAAFQLESAALRTEHDPAQILWKSAARRDSRPANISLLRQALSDLLEQRGEPTGYLPLHLAGLATLAENRALTPPVEFDEALRSVSALIESTLKENRFVHYSSGERVESGLWGLSAFKEDALADRVEIAVVNFLQTQERAALAEIEEHINERFNGLLTPSRGLLLAILNSYAENQAGAWVLRPEDRAAARRAEMESVFSLLEETGRRLGYAPRRREKIITWQEGEAALQPFYVFASGLLRRALQATSQETILVFPGGRAGLIAYKQERDPALKAEMKPRRVLKYRLLRSIAEMPALSRESFLARIQSDPIKKDERQMWML